VTRQEEIDALYDQWELLLPGQPTSLLAMDRPDPADNELRLLRLELESKEYRAWFEKKNSTDHHV
jgi:hypothetical protein